jgi:hypothetical protein
MFFFPGHLGFNPPSCAQKRNQRGIESTLRSSNVAIENPPLDDLPIKTSMEDLQLHCLITKRPKGFNKKSYGKFATNKNDF